MEGELGLVVGGIGLSLAYMYCDFLLELPQGAYDEEPSVKRPQTPNTQSDHRKFC